MTHRPDATRMYIADVERSGDMLRATPRQRVAMNRSTPMPLTGSWQAIPFAPGTSAYDANTFPAPRYDFERQRIIVNHETNYEQAYTISLDLGVTLSTNNAFLKLALRFFVAGATDPGGPLAFPLPESIGRIDLPDQIVPPGGAVHFDYPVYANALTRQYGAQVQIRATTYQLNSGLTGAIAAGVVAPLVGTERPMLRDAVMNMYAI